MPVAVTSPPPSINLNRENLAVPKTSMPTKQDNDMANTKRKIICFSDFDGTIFMQDTGHVLVDAHGCGASKRELLDEQIKTGERSFREVSEEMWGSLNVPFDDGFSSLSENLSIDPDFQTFHQYCIQHSIPFNVISAGLKPILRRVLDEFLGEEESRHIDIVANEAHINTPGTEWKPVWLHDTELGHDKARSIGEARERAGVECEDGTVPLIVFIGDGVSDLPAAREADVLFARRGLRLEEYCIEHAIPYIAFDTFADIQREVEKIRLEDERLTHGKGVPARFNPRANLWRRVSSQNAVHRYVAATPSNEEKIFLWPGAFSEYKPKTIAENVAV